MISELSARSVVTDDYPPSRTGTIALTTLSSFGGGISCSASSRRRCSVGSCSSSPRRCRVQTPAPPAGQPTAPGLRKLTGDDAKRAEELDKAIEAALKADRWDEAIAKAEELLALRTRVQGPKHFETVNAEWRLKTLRRVAPMPQEDRVAYQSASTMNEQAETLYAQGKYAEAQPLFEKALEIRRRLLTDDHPDTATSYNNLAVNLNAQGKYAEAQPLFEKALEIRRRLLTDDHPDTATSYNNLAANLNAQGKYAAGPAAAREGAGDPPPPAHRRPPRHRHQLQQPGDQPQRPGEVRRRPSRCSRRRWRSAAACSPTTTPTPPPATTTWRPTSTPRGSTPQAQPLFEKALEIRRRLLTDDHPDTAAKLQQPGAQPQRPGEVRRGPAAVREGAGDPPPPAHRRPPRHRQQLQQPGVQPQRPGEVRRRPSRCSRRRWRSAAACSPTTTPTPPPATTTWRPTSTPRGSTPRPSRCSRRRWRSAAACSPTTTPTPPPATTTWRPTSTPRGSTSRRETNGCVR